MNNYRLSKHNHKLGEGIIWDHNTQLLLFVDILSKKFFRMDIDSFNIVDEYLFDEYIGWAQLTDKPELYLVGMKSGIALFDFQKFQLNYINKDIPQFPNQRLNDSFIDINGKVWYGTMEEENIHLYNGILASYSSKDKKVIIHDNGYGITNGPIIDHQNNYLYHTDSKKGIVYKFSLNLEKNLIFNKSTFIDFNINHGVPDGMCFDKEGNIYVAIWGGGCVNKYTSLGEFIYSYKLPAKYVTNISFGGKLLDKLFVTTAIHDEGNSTGSQLKNGYVFEVLNHNSQGVLMNEYLI